MRVELEGRNFESAMARPPGGSGQAGGRGCTDAGGEAAESGIPGAGPCRDPWAARRGALAGRPAARAHGATPSSRCAVMAYAASGQRSDRGAWTPAPARRKDPHRALPLGETGRPRAGRAVTPGYSRTQGLGGGRNDFLHHRRGQHSWYIPRWSPPPRRRACGSTRARRVLRRPTRGRPGDPGVPGSRRVS